MRLGFVRRNSDFENSRAAPALVRPTAKYDALDFLDRWNLQLDGPRFRARTDALLLANERFRTSGFESEHSDAASFDVQTHRNRYPAGGSRRAFDRQHRAVIPRTRVHDDPDAIPLVGDDAFVQRGESAQIQRVLQGGRIRASPRDRTRRSIGRPR